MTTSTIGTSGRDYSTCKAWADAAAATLSDTWFGECYNDGTITETAVVQLDSTSDATNYMKLTTASGQSFMDHANKLTNPLRADQTKGVLIDITTHTVAGFAIRADYCVIEKVQIKDNRASYATIDGKDTGSSNNWVRNVVLQSNTNGSEAVINIRRMVLVNSAIVVSGASANGVLASSSSSVGGTVGNCTILASAGASGYAIGDRYSSTQVPVVKNTATFGFGADNEVASGSTNNATDRANFATNSSSDQESLTASSQIENTTGSSEDLRAKSGGALPINGTRDQTNTNDLDIVGQTRSTTTPTIGAWEVVAGGASAEEALTGQAATSGIGTMVPNISVAL